MERLTANISGATRREVLFGKSHLVAPATLIVPGVLNGSKGPLLYPSDEVSKSALAWNGMPLLVYHPSEGSGRKPNVLNKQGIGYVFDTKFQDGKLTADLWFDVERVKLVDSRVLDWLQNNQQIELSTGLGTQNEVADPEAASTGQVPYTHIARHYKPDHLAILPDQVGACSLDDGCGVNQNYSKTHSEMVSLRKIQNAKGGDVALTEKEKKEIVDELIDNSCCWEEQDRAELDKMSDNQLQKTKLMSDKEKEAEEVVSTNREGYESDKKTWEAKEAELVKNQKSTKGEAMTDEQWMAQAPESVKNTLSHARESEQGEKKALIDQITQNVEENAKPEKVAFLSEKNIGELRQIASFMPASQREFIQNFYPGQPAEKKEVIDRTDMLEPQDIDYVANSVFAASQ